MKHPPRTNALRLALLALAGAAAATLGACRNDGSSDTAGFGANMPNWSNNGSADSGSSTAGPEGDAGRAMDSDYDRNVSGPFWNHF